MRAASKNQPSENQKAEEIALRYKLLQSQADQIDRVLRALKSELESFVARDGKDGLLRLETFDLRISNCERETFSLKSARKSLPEKTLKPFISITSYTRLVVSERGNGKIAA